MTARLDRPPIVRLRGGSRNSPKLKSHQWLSATHPRDQNYETGSPYVPYFEIPLYGEAVTKKRANRKLRPPPITNPEKYPVWWQKRSLLQASKHNFQRYLRDTPPLCTRRIAAYRVRSHPRTCSFPRSPPRRPRCSPPSRPATPRRPPTFAEEVPTIISEGMFSASRPPWRSPGPSTARAGSA